MIAAYVIRENIQPWKFRAIQYLIGFIKSGLTQTFIFKNSQIQSHTYM